jgi:hypothetical protein
VASEFGLSCDIGVRRLPRALTIRVRPASGWGVDCAVEHLVRCCAAAHGVAVALTGELAESDEFVGAALAASDDLQMDVQPQDIAAALDLAWGVLWREARSPDVAERALPSAPRALREPQSCRGELARARTS